MNKNKCSACGQPIAAVTGRGPLPHAGEHRAELWRVLGLGEDAEPTPAGALVERSSTRPRRIVQVNASLAPLKWSSK